MRNTILFLLIMGALYWFWPKADPFAHAPIGYIATEPVQSVTSTPPFLVEDYSIWKKTYKIAPQGFYDISGRVLHVKRYFSQRYTGNLVAFDLGLGWKAMSDLSVLSQGFSFDHKSDSGGGRFLWTELLPDEKGKFAPLPRETGDVMQQISNNHLVPSDIHVFRQLGSLKQGDLVRVRGYLVNITDPENPDWTWTTSTVRNDTSNHWGGNNTSCETIYVTSVERIVSTNPPVTEAMPEWFWPFL